MLAGRDGIGKMKENPIDFPCSYSWRAYYAETMEDIYLPSIEIPEPKIETHIVKQYVTAHIDKVSLAHNRRLNNLESQAKELKRILNEKLNKKRIQPSRKKGGIEI